MTEEKIQDLSSILLVALQALSIASPQCRLRYLGLAVDTQSTPAGVSRPTPGKVNRPDNFTRVLRAAKFGFHITARALAKHALPLASLDIFGATSRCSLDASELLHLIKMPGESGRTLHGLRSLSVYLSFNKVYPKHSKVQAWDIFTDFHAVSDVLRTTPNLDSLSI
ncbi:hypothetical protein B0A48_14980 [Cryoendolithus antarcticus]|uniref:Uncharacterized protein n=1 Tax=Cryoendolithus antarcticus TaxID=1507870 RepID=A0A1V8SJ46_9PEZI|nr:hypothetical protein B0A48_14980 [Cryoendolithus antarcticus]